MLAIIICYLILGILFNYMFLKGSQISFFEFILFLISWPLFVGIMLSVTVDDYIKYKGLCKRKK